MHAREMPQPRHSAQRKNTADTLGKPEYREHRHALPENVE
jgi:hypothetical protein